MVAAVALLVEMVSAGNCWSCGVPIYLPRSKYDSCHKNHSNNFYCCNGHSAVFTGETEAEKLRKELETEKARTQKERDRVQMERNRREAAERSAAAHKGQVTAIKNRVGNGVCPCCKRTFKQLAAHMAHKHPGFKSEEA